MKKRAVLFSIVFLIGVRVHAAEPIAAGAGKEESPLSRMLSSAATPKSKPARRAGVQKGFARQKAQAVAAGEQSGLMSEELQAFFREEELPPSQELLDKGAKLYAMLQRSDRAYDKNAALALFREFKDMGGTMTIKGDRVANRRFNELRRERLKVMRRR